MQDVTRLSGNIQPGVKSVTTYYTKGKLKGRLQKVERYENGKHVNTMTYFYDKNGMPTHAIQKTFIPSKSTKKFKAVKEVHQ